MPPNLPLELYHLIIHHVSDKADLCSLTLCCSAFRDQAQQCLFRHVEPVSLAQQDRFLSAINTSPLRLGPLVHRFLVDYSHIDENKSLAPLATALHTMVGLKDLGLLWWDPSMILYRCSFQLRTFACPKFLAHDEVRFMLFEFLPTQTALKHLEINGCDLNDVSKAPKGMHRQLVSLNTSSELFARVILSDTVFISCFRWLNTYKPPPITIRQLNHLKFLGFSAHVLKVDLSFTMHLTSLVDLELYLLRRIPDYNLLFLENIPDLQVLTLNVTYANLVIADKEFYHNFNPLCRRAFELCPRLKHVDVTDESRAEKCTRLVHRATTDNGVVIWTQSSTHLTDVWSRSA